MFLNEFLSKATSFRSWPEAISPFSFVFASNGDGFVFHDKTVKEGEGDLKKTLTLDEFPSPSARGLTNASSL